MSLFLAKADWFSVIRFGRNFFKRFARTFEKTLYNTLYKLMGLNSITNSGLLTFGIRVIKEWLIGEGNVPILSQDRIELVTLESTVDQKC